MTPTSGEEDELTKAERLKDEYHIDEWLLEQAIRSGHPKPMNRIKMEFDPEFCRLLIEIVEKYRQKP
jgi:hypothetical protein